LRALPASGPIAAAWPAVIAPNMKQNIEMNILLEDVGPSYSGHSYVISPIARYMRPKVAF